MLNKGVIKSVINKDPHVLPIKLQVLHIYNCIGRKLKVKVSDGEYITDVYVSGRNQALNDLKPRTIISVSSLDYLETSFGQIIEFKQFEFTENHDFIIGNPRVYLNENSEISNEDLFTVHCINCDKIITQSAYLLENLVFSYIKNVSFGRYGEIYCDCNTQLGVRTENFYVVYEKSIKLEKFPSTFERNSYIKNLEACKKCFTDLFEYVKELEASYDRRLKEVDDLIMQFRKCK